MALLTTCPIVVSSLFIDSGFEGCWFSEAINAAHKSTKNGGRITILCIGDPLLKYVFHIPPFLSQWAVCLQEIAEKAVGPFIQTVYFASVRTLR